MELRDLDAVNHDHHYARQSLTLLSTAISCSNCPPEGHIFWNLLRDAATYFTHALPEHLQEEEETIFPRFNGIPGADAIDSLYLEHDTLRGLASEFGKGAAKLAARPYDHDWHQMREVALHLESALRGHLAHEEEVLRHLVRTSRSAMADV